MPNLLDPFTLGVSVIVFGFILVIGELLVQYYHGLQEQKKLDSHIAYIDSLRARDRKK